MQDFGRKTGNGARQLRSVEDALEKHRTLTLASGEAPQQSVSRLTRVVQLKQVERGAHRAHQSPGLGQRTDAGCLNVRAAASIQPQRSSDHQIIRSNE
jgi:hypothetical protein